MNIKMHRGDTCYRSFKILNKDKTVYEGDFDEIFLTVRVSYTAKDFIFQKKLSTNEIIKDEENVYHFTILPEDTNNLKMEQEYVFDIELNILDPLYRQTILGTLSIESEVTIHE